MISVRKLYLTEIQHDYSNLTFLSDLYCVVAPVSCISQNGIDTDTGREYNIIKNTAYI